MPPLPPIAQVLIFRSGSKDTTGFEVCRIQGHSSNNLELRQKAASSTLLMFYGTHAWRSTLVQVAYLALNDGNADASGHEHNTSPLLISTIASYRRSEAVYVLACSQTLALRFASRLCVSL